MRCNTGPLSSPTARSLMTSPLSLPQATPTAQKWRTCLSTRGKSQTTLCRPAEAQHAGLRRGGGPWTTQSGLRSMTSDPLAPQDPQHTQHGACLPPWEMLLRFTISSVEAAATAETPLTRSQQAPADLTFSFLFNSI